MDLDELQSVRDRERQTDKLQQLRESFYSDAGEFIQQLREQRARAAERADDPFDAPEVSRLSDEIDTAEQTVEAIYEKRVGKIVKAASFAAADLPAESEGMTREEQDLFETLVADIKQNRQHVLDVLAGEDSARESTPTDAQPDGPTPSEQESTSGVSAADVMSEGGPSEPSGSNPQQKTDGPPEQAPPGTADTPAETRRDESPTATGESGEQSRQADSSAPERPGTSGLARDEQSPAPETERAPGPGDKQSLGQEDESMQSEARPTSETSPDATEQRQVDRKTVRITDDVGEIFGVDEREYDLSEDDVVTLPSANADPLVERDAAERLD